MLKLLVKASSIFKKFIFKLQLKLSKPQMDHLLRISEAIILCDEKKTLSSLHRITLDAPDVSAAADFLRQSRWNDAGVRKALAKFTIEYAIEKARKEYSFKPEIIIALDDSTTRKDKGTKNLEAVSWHFDHAGSGKGQTQYCKGVVHLNLRILIGSYGFTFTWRIYSREKVIRKLNNKRVNNKRLGFKSKNTLAQEMLAELIPFIPEDLKVYVLFDRWYTSAKLIRYIIRRGWHVIAAIKSNRKIDGIQIKNRQAQLRNKRYTEVKYIAADGEQKNYFVRRINGRLTGLPDEVCVLLSKRHYRDKNSKYFICTDTELSEQKILTLYSKRWPIEVEYWYLKNCLGLGDFRVWSYEAILRWYTIVYLVLTFLQWRLYEERYKNLQDCRINTVAHIIGKHRKEHIVSMLRYVYDEAVRGMDINYILNRFVGSG